MPRVIQICNSSAIICKLKFFEQIFPYNKIIINSFIAHLLQFVLGFIYARNTNLCILYISLGIFIADGWEEGVCLYYDTNTKYFFFANNNNRISNTNNNNNKRGTDSGYRCFFVGKIPNEINHKFWCELVQHNPLTQHNTTNYINVSKM